MYRPSQMLQAIFLLQIFKSSCHFELELACLWQGLTTRTQELQSCRNDAIEGRVHLQIKYKFFLLLNFAISRN